MTTGNQNKNDTDLIHLKILCAQFKKYIVQGVTRVCLPESKVFVNAEIRRPAGDLNEAQVRQSFILPLVSTLGWDTEDPFEVYPEERVNGGFIDIRLRLPTGDSLIWEIKRPSVDLDLGTDSGKEAAYQGIGYARTFNNAPFCVVTNFERTLIFHSYNFPSKERVVDNLVASFTWIDAQEGKANDVLRQLSKSNVTSNQFRAFFDKAIKNKSVIKTRRPLEERILEDLEVWRISLIKSLSAAVTGTSVEDLDLAVQVIVNRIMFIRCCEDRGVETEARIRPLLESRGIWKQLIGEIFSYYRASYNSDLFAEHPIANNDRLEVDDKVIRTVLAQSFTGTGKDTHEMYDFSLIPLEVLGTAYESYLAKQVVKEGRSFKLELKPELLKSGGVCYTPSFIVEHIVQKALSGYEQGRSRKFMPKVLDPACGSGTFLISSLRFLIERNRPAAIKKSEQKKLLSLKEKRELLEKCLFGVDLDPKAVEITKLSLLLLLLEGEREGMLIKSALLPTLDKNIRRGNSLVSPEAISKYLPDAQISELHPLDWDSFKTNVGAPNGFDAVIGNPPYVRIQVLQEFFPRESIIYSAAFPSAADGNVDLYVPFLEQATRLCASKGYVGYILPTRFWANDYGRNLRKQISDGKLLEEAISFRAEQVFAGVTTYTCILILKKSGRKTFKYFEPRERGEAPASFISHMSKNPAAYGQDLSASVLSEDPWLLAPPSVREHVLQLEKAPKKLRDYVLEKPGIFQGLINGRDPTFLLQIKNSELQSEELGYAAVNLEQEYLVPILKGGADVKRLQIPKPDLRLLYPYRLDDAGKAKLLTYSEINRTAPRTASYLKRVELPLRYRAALKTKPERDADLKANPKKFKDPADPQNTRWFYDGPDFYKYSRNQALDCVLRQKLIVPAMFKKPAFFWDQEGTFALTGSGSGGGGAYAMYLRDGFEAKALALVGILSSSVLAEWYDRRGDLFQGYYVGVDEKILLGTPLPDLSDRRLQEDVKILGRLVKQILSVPSDNGSLYSEILGSIDAVVMRMYLQR